MLKFIVFAYPDTLLPERVSVAPPEYVQAPKVDADKSPVPLVAPLDGNSVTIGHVKSLEPET